MKTLTEQILDAMERSGKSRYAISNESGVSEGHLSRLVHGENRLGVETAERIAEALGYQIVLKRAKKTGGR